MGNFFHSKKFLVLLVILWVVLLAAALLLMLPGNGLSARFNRQYPIAAQAAQPSGYGPYGYGVLMGTEFWSKNSKDHQPFTQLYEDGQLLGPADALHAVIGTRGGGRFSLWNDGFLYFSSSDNSDPRTNGRQYTLVLPNYTLINWSLVILLTSTLIFGFYCFRPMPKIAKNRYLFYVSIIIVGIAFVIPRLAWFVDYPLPLIQQDTSTYFAPVRQMLSGHLPIFSLRTPGYPLFLTLSLGIFHYLKFTVILQSLLTLGSALFFVWATYKTYCKLVICAGITMVAHVAQPFIVENDFALLSESVYSSCLVLFIGFLMLAICTQKARYALLFSIVGGYAFWVRPSGIFLFGILLFIILYMVVNSYPRKNVFCLALPMPIMLILLLSYNYFSFGSFTLSSIGDLSLYGITSVYWEPDASFPVKVNKGIQKFTDEISESDKHLLNTSWDPIKLQPLFADNVSKAVYSFKDGVYNNPDLHLSKDAQIELMRKIAWKAIKSHPDMTVKCFWSTLYVFLDDESSWNGNLYLDIHKFIPEMYGAGGLAKDEFISREYVSMPSIPAISIKGKKGEDLQVEIVPTLLYKINREITYYLRKVFDLDWLRMGYFIVLIISMYMTVRSKLRIQSIFILFTVSSILLLAGVTTALVTTMSDRYPSPTRFIEVFSIAFIPLFFNGHRRTDQKVAKIRCTP